MIEEFLLLSKKFKINKSSSSYCLSIEKFERELYFAYHIQYIYMFCILHIFKEIILEEYIRNNNTKFNCNKL